MAVVLVPQAAGGAPRAKVETRGHVTVFSLTPAQAEQVAGVCAARGAAACGDLITRGDGAQLAADCGRTGRQLAGMLRAAARAAPSGAAVELRTENGGYPYICAFAARVSGSGWCDRQRISAPELEALPLFERLFALVRSGFCVGSGWVPDLGS